MARGATPIADLDKRAVLQKAGWLWASHEILRCRSNDLRQDPAAASNQANLRSHHADGLSVMKAFRLDACDIAVTNELIPGHVSFAWRGMPCIPALLTVRSSCPAWPVLMVLTTIDEPIKYAKQAAKRNRLPDNPFRYYRGGVSLYLKPCSRLVVGRRRTQGAAYAADSWCCTPATGQITQFVGPCAAIA